MGFWKLAALLYLQALSSGCLPPRQQRRAPADRRMPGREHRRACGVAAVSDWREKGNRATAEPDPVTPDWVFIEFAV